MYFKFCILFLASVIAWENVHQIDGLEGLPKCQASNIFCVIENINRIIKAIVKPFKKYDIQGYESVKMNYTFVDLPSSALEVKMSVTITGLNDTKLVHFCVCCPDNENGICRDNDKSLSFSLSFTSNQTLFGTLSITHHLSGLDKTNDYTVNGSIEGLNLIFSAPFTLLSNNSQMYLDLGKESLLNLEMNNVTFAEAIDIYPSDPDIRMLTNSTEFYHQFVRNIVEGTTAVMFEENRKFFKNIPLSEFMDLETDM